jgi:hypothetical protein
MQPLDKRVSLHLGLSRWSRSSSAVKFSSRRGSILIGSIGSTQVQVQVQRSGRTRRRGRSLYALGVKDEWLMVETHKRGLLKAVVLSEHKARQKTPPRAPRKSVKSLEGTPGRVFNGLASTFISTRIKA